MAKRRGASNVKEMSQVPYEEIHPNMVDILGTHLSIEQSLWTMLRASFRNEDAKKDPSIDLMFGKLLELCRLFMEPHGARRQFFEAVHKLNVVRNTLVHPKNGDLERQLAELENFIRENVQTQTPIQSKKEDDLRSMLDLLADVAHAIASHEIMEDGGAARKRFRDRGFNF